MEIEYADRIKGLKASAIREILKFTADPSVISFAAGNPAPEAFPVKEIAKLPLIYLQMIRSPLCSTV